MMPLSQALTPPVTLPGCQEVPADTCCHMQVVSPRTRGHQVCIPVDPSAPKPRLTHTHRLAPTTHRHTQPSHTLTPSHTQPHLQPHTRLHTSTRTHVAHPAHVVMAHTQSHTDEEPWSPAPSRATSESVASRQDVTRRGRAIRGDVTESKTQRLLEQRAWSRRSGAAGDPNVATRLSSTGRHQTPSGLLS